MRANLGLGQWSAILIHNRAGYEAAVRTAGGSGDRDHNQQVQNGVHVRQLGYSPAEQTMPEVRGHGRGIIALWQHNWEKRPLEVIELRKAIER